MMRTARPSMIIAVAALTALSELGVQHRRRCWPATGIVGIKRSRLRIAESSSRTSSPGLFLLLENAVEIGDSVTVSGLSGVVENLIDQHRSALRAGDGSVITSFRSAR